MFCTLAFFELKCVLPVYLEETPTSLGILYSLHKLILLGNLHNVGHWTKCLKEYSDESSIDFAFCELVKATRHARSWGTGCPGLHPWAMETHSRRDTPTMHESLTWQVISELSCKEWAASWQVYQRPTCAKAQVRTRCKNSKGIGLTGANTLMSLEGK